MAVVSMKALLESGVHFGHRTNKWDPRMKPYIFTERNGIHIIDLQQTVKLLNQAYNVIRDAVANGGTVMFVGTKRQAQETVKEEANACGNALCHRTLAGRHADQLVHHVCPYPGTGTAGETARHRRDQPADQEGRPADPARDRPPADPFVGCPQHEAPA